jgi:hypothetical protein
MTEFLHQMRTVHSHRHTRCYGSPRMTAQPNRSSRNAGMGRYDRGDPVDFVGLNSCYVLAVFVSIEFQ